MDEKLTKEEKEQLVPKFVEYLAAELDLDIGRFDAEFLLDYVGKEVGAIFYTRGLKDAQTALMKHMDDFDETIYTLEQKTKEGR